MDFIFQTSDQLKDRLFDLWSNETLLIFNAGLNPNSEAAREWVKQKESEIVLGADKLMLAWIESVRLEFNKEK